MVSVTPRACVGQLSLPVESGATPSRFDLRLQELDGLIARQAAEHAEIAGRRGGDRAAGGAVAPVRINAKSASPDDPQTRPTPLQTRFALQAAARALLPEQRVSKCLRVRHGESVQVNYHGDGSGGEGSASYAGLVTCASVWHCPCCAAKITERRREELSRAVLEWERQGGRVVMVTYTLRHQRGDDLREMLKRMGEARKRMLSGKANKEFNARYHVEGRVRALEPTHGENGWHPHYHELLFVVGRPDTVRMQEELLARWGAAVLKAGLRDINEHGCVISYAESGVLTVAEYCAKLNSELGDLRQALGEAPVDRKRWGPDAELAKMNTKQSRKGRNPLQLLAAYAAGDRHAGMLWREYAEAFKGQRFLSWSRGLKARLGVAEKTDAQLVEEAGKGGRFLGNLSPVVWKRILKRDLRAQLLEKSAAGDWQAVGLWLATEGLIACATRWLLDARKNAANRQGKIRPPAEMVD